MVNPNDWPDRNYSWNANSNIDGLINVLFVTVGFLKSKDFLESDTNMLNP